LFDVNETEFEEVPGQSVYYSTTGAANSWTRIDTFNTSGPVGFTIGNLGTSFGDNTLYLLWADDNAIVSSTSGETTFIIDDLTYGRTLGQSKAPGGGSFGTRVGGGAHTFDGGDTLDLAILSGGAIAHQPDGQGGSQNNSLHLNNGTLQVVTELVDLRALTTTAIASIDLKVWEDDLTTDFETADFVDVVAEYSADGIVFTPIHFTPNLHGGAQVDDPADSLKTLEAFSGSSNIGPYVHFSLTLPSSAQTVRVRIDAQNDSPTEHFYFDNLRVSAIPVPEPSSVMMIGCGMIGLIGYGMRRQRSNV
jgi:hypothetical protein